MTRRRIAEDRPLSPTQVRMGEMHGRRLVRQRKVLAYIRKVTPEGLLPAFRQIAWKMRHDGLYSPKTMPANIELGLRRVWATRKYLDSQEADRHYRKSPNARM